MDWLITLAIAMPVAFAEQVAQSASGIGLSPVMSGEQFFRTGQLPWGGLAFAVTTSTVLLYLAARNFERRDF